MMRVKGFIWVGNEQVHGWDDDDDDDERVRWDAYGEESK